MILCVLGHGQLARVTTTCCRRHFAITETPELGCDVLWICHDTPVDTLDQSNVDSILEDVRPLLARLRPGPIVLISAQLPVGTTARLETEFPQHTFACSPENIRVAHGIADFERQARIVVGGRSLYIDNRLKMLFSPFTDNLIYVGTETAEMVKHALNGFMACSIAYINEVATLCRMVGANPEQVAECVKADPRVGSRARLNPGAPYSGGTLARDVFTMAKLGGARTPLIGHIKASNDRKDF